MTLKEFLVHLSSIKNKKKVRKYLTNGFATKSCPIIAVTKKLTNANFAIADWDIAAKKIGLAFRTAEKIVDAADGSCYRDPKLRNKLLIAVGLPIETNGEDDE